MARRSARQTRIVPHLAPQTIITEAKRSAWKPFRELAKRGVPPSLIELFMFKLMVRQWTRKRTDWDEPKSMKRHTLKRFPARIQQMAQDIEALNADPVLGPLDGAGGVRNISEFHFRSGRSDTPTSLFLAHSDSSLSLLEC